VGHMQMAHRKSFSGAGRAPLLPPRRWSNGRIERDRGPESVAEIKAVVLSQPHRKNAPEPIAWDLVTVVGRLVLNGRVTGARNFDGTESPPRLTLIEAAKRYRQDWDYYQAKRLGSRRPLAVTEGKTLWDNPEREEEERKKAERRWGDVGSAVRDWLDKRGQRADFKRVQDALQHAILEDQPDDWIVPFWIEHSLKAGLVALVSFYGLEG
jgi:hypothetical protein